MTLKNFLTKPMEIIFEPDERLRKVSTPVTFPWQPSEMEQLAQTMFKLMREAEGIGLAAPQVGLNLRIILILEIKESIKIQKDPTTNQEVPKKVVTTQPTFMINPEIVHKSGEICLEEGCLSIKNKKITVKRSNEVTVKYQTISGKTVEKILTGINSVCVQHEIDHLDGILMVDYN